MSNISRKEFFDLLELQKDRPNGPVRGKADWDEIYKELKKVNVPMDIKTIHEVFVDQVVTRYRTKNKLQEWAKAERCLEIYEGGKYYYYFGRLPPGMRKKLEAIRKERADTEKRIAKELAEKLLPIPK